MVTERGSSLESSKDFKSIYSLFKFFFFFGYWVPNGMSSSISTESVDDLAGSPENTWSKMA